ncbi:hypothetical protein ACVK1X_005112 [Pseudomonas sp. PvR086]|jgi:hypothetical protein|nr:hypothetical protein F475_01227 [Pseudomonas sp. URMO17WK12:I6]CAH0271046.1 hypothetical protein SRABI130_03783 [Pseudomonas sp. Bi130]
MDERTFYDSGKLKVTGVRSVVNDHIYTLSPVNST